MYFIILRTKFEITIYTMAGCEACKIMQNLVKQVVPDDIPVRIEEIPSDKNGLAIRKVLRINDFPTTVLYKNKDDVKIPMVDIVGTRPAVEIRKLILKCYLVF